MFIKAEDSPFEDLQNVTEENLESFCERLTKWHEEEELKLLEPIVPLVLGNTSWARFVRGGKSRKFSLERQFLQTVVDGRLYTVEMQVFPKTILKHRDHAYAVGAGMKFTTPAGEEPPTEEQPEGAS